MEKLKLLKVRMTFFTVFVLAMTGLNGLNAQNTARLQVIHNAADPGAEIVDIYLDGALLLDDFAFRTATPFIDAPANQTINIGIAPGNSGSVNDTITNIPANLTAGETYVAVANGVLGPNNFAPNPDGRSISFDLFASDGVRESASGSDVDFIVLHGATDAPTVDVIARNVATIVNDAAYGDFTNYITVPAASYILDVTPGNDNNTVVATFAADLSGLGGGAAVVFASGFLNPAANQNGEPFGIFAALPDGNVVEFPQLTTARLQVIHNAADPGAEIVDIYLNGSLLLDDFAFRTATPFIDAPANQVLNIGIAPGNSGSVNDTIANIPANLMAGETFVAIANGVLNPAGFSPNPDGRNIAFQLFTKDEIRESGKSSDVDFIVVHGSTDAPTVDVIARGVTTLVDNAAYGDITNYITVPPTSYILDITPGNDPNSVMASFDADLAALGGGSAIVLASGFLNPAANQNGPAFGLIAVLADGMVLTLPSAPVGISPTKGFVPDMFQLEQNYPNPFNPSTFISFAIPQSEVVNLTVHNILGQEVAVLLSERLNAGSYEVDFDARDLASGTYFYILEAGSFRSVKKMTLLK